MDWFFNHLIMGCLLPRDLILLASYSACLLQFRTRCAAVAWIIATSAIIYGVFWFDDHESWMNQAIYATIYFAGIPFVTRWVTIPLALMGIHEVIGVFDHLVTPADTFYSVSVPYVQFVFGLLLTVSLWKDYHDGGRGSTMVSLFSSVYHHVFGNKTRSMSISSKK